MPKRDMLASYSKSVQLGAELNEKPVQSKPKKGLLTKTMDTASVDAKFNQPAYRAASYRKMLNDMRNDINGNA